MDLVTRLFARPAALRRWAMASLIANSVIVVTGALVRLTGSGLGCPTWPRCTADSFVTTPEMGVHGIIEFGNRLLTFVLIVIAIGTFVSAVLVERRHRGSRTLRRVATLTALGIPIQAVLGGITVHMQLHPFVVAPHLLLSGVLICLCTWLVALSRGHRARVVAGWRAHLASVVFVLAWVVCWLGTIVTGSGPHAGDADSPRTGYPVELTAKLHAGAVWALVVATVVALVLLGGRSLLALLLIELGQGVIGYTQYFLGVPVPLVLAHMVGMCLTLIAATSVLLSFSRSRGGEPPASSGSSAPGAAAALR